MRHSLGHKSKQILFAVCGIFAIAAVIWGFVVEPNQLFVRYYALELPRWPVGLDGMKVALISDIHAGSSFINRDKVRQVVDETNETHPDLILLLGDYVSALHGHCLIEPDAFVGELSRLKANIGVYAVLGNHDWWYNETKTRNALIAQKINVLDNAAVRVTFNGEPLYLAGVADLWSHRADVRKALSTVPQNAPVILLSHNPDIFPSVPASVNLTVAGHTHGGQVALPLIGPLIVPSDCGNRYAWHSIVEDGRHLFVTTGIGTSVIPVRFLVPPEVSVLILRNVH